MKTNKTNKGTKIGKLASLAIICSSILFQSCGSNENKTIVGADLSANSIELKITANTVNNIKFNGSNFKSASLNTLIDYNSNYIKRNKGNLIEIPLANELSKMSLTVNQADQIKNYAKSFYELENSILEPVIDSEMEIVKSANSKIHDIQLSLHSGKLSEKSAKAKIIAINVETENKLKNNPLRLSAKVAFENSIETYLHSIKNVLNQEQLNNFASIASHNKELLSVVAN